MKTLSWSGRNRAVDDCFSKLAQRDPANRVITKDVVGEARRASDGSSDANDALLSDLAIAEALSAWTAGARTWKFTPDALTSSFDQKTIDEIDRRKSVMQNAISAGRDDWWKAT